jgi:hypothetical protein
MTVAEILVVVKNTLGVTGSYQDSTLTCYINEVIEFMRSAGVTDPTSSAAVGCISRGVADLWNYGAGEAKLSEYFKMRVIQLVGG